MGTRGFIGWAIDGQLKMAYNHFDSYPSGLGVGVLEWLREAQSTGDKHAAMVEAVRALRVIPQDAPPPTAEQIQEMKRYANPGVGGPITNKEVHDWYQLLRNTQGDPAAILDAGYIEDASDFAQDSLFCEWGYLIDLDEGVLEVYEGFQTKPHSSGRFAPPTDQVALIRRYQLNGLPTNEEFLEDTEPEED